MARPAYTIAKSDKPLVVAYVARKIAPDDTLRCEARWLKSEIAKAEFPGAQRSEKRLTEWIYQDFDAAQLSALKANVRQRKKRSYDNDPTHKHRHLTRRLPHPGIPGATREPDILTIHHRTVSRGVGEAW
jgi:hypothetical protein